MPVLPRISKTFYSDRLTKLVQQSTNRGASLIPTGQIFSESYMGDCLRKNVPRVLSFVVYHTEATRTTLKVKGRKHISQNTCKVTNYSTNNKNKHFVSSALHSSQLLRNSFLQIPISTVSNHDSSPKLAPRILQTIFL